MRRVGWTNYMKFDLKFSDLSLGALIFSISALEFFNSRSCEKKYLYSILIFNDFTTFRSEFDDVTDRRRHSKRSP